jgi:hypothetical protein
MDKKRLVFKDIVRDIQFGLRDAEIRAKYGLTQKKLKNVQKELLNKGLLNNSDLGRRRDLFFKRIRKLAIIAIFSDDDLMNRLVLKGGNADCSIYTAYILSIVHPRVFGGQ